MRGLLSLLGWLLWATAAWAQPTMVDLETISPVPTGEWDFEGGKFHFPEVPFASLPAAGTSGRIYVVTDSSSCTADVGTARVICRDTGAAWEAIGSGGGGGTECSTSACNLNASTTLNSQGICLANGTNCPGIATATPTATSTVATATPTPTVTVTATNQILACPTVGDKGGVYGITDRYGQIIQAVGCKPTPTPTVSPTPTLSATPTVTATATVTVTPTPTSTATLTPVLCPTNGNAGGLYGAHPEVCQVTPTPTVSPTPTLSATPTVTVTATPCAGDTWPRGDGSCETLELGTDSAGNYAGSSSEGGPANDVSCASCVTLSSEVTGTLPLANGGTGAALTDPNADRIMFWDDSAGATAYLEPSTGLAIQGTAIVAVTPVYYVTPTPYPTWTPGPTPTEPFLRYWFLPTTVPASTPPGLMLHRNDLPGPPLVGTPTATATFTPGGGVATVTPTPTPTFTTGGGAATPTATLSATPTPTVTATPIGRQAVYDTLGVRTLASLDDLPDLQIGSTHVANGINVRALNFDSADFASITCTGSPPTCAIALNSSVMRSTTTLLNSQLPTPLIKSDDQAICLGTDSDWCAQYATTLAWVQAGNVPLNLGPTPTPSATPTVTAFVTSTVTPGAAVTPTVQATPTVTGATATPTTVATPALLVRGQDVRSCHVFCISTAFANNTYYGSPAGGNTTNGSLRVWFRVPMPFSGYFRNLTCQSNDKDPPLGSRHTTTIEVASCAAGSSTADGTSHSCTWSVAMRATLSGTKNPAEMTMPSAPTRSGTYPAGTSWQWVDTDVNTFGTTGCCVEFCPEP